MQIMPRLTISFPSLHIPVNICLHRPDLLLASQPMNLPLDISHLPAKYFNLVHMSQSPADARRHLSGHVLCEGNLVMKVQSAFFFHGRFMDYKNTFKMIDEPNYSVELVTDADVGILLLKDWFKWAGESKPLTAGMCHWTSK